jgi:glycerophosphoryl diester phosphodiesterase
LIFAHRGGAALAPENTLAAFEQAASLGADGFELDVRLSRDGAAVVHHDSTLDRTTDASGPVRRLTADELARLDAGHRFGPERGYPWRGRAGGVPRLRDVLRRFADRRLVIEVKGTNRALLDAVVADIRETNALDRVSIGAYAARLMWRARKRETRIATGASYMETRWALYRLWFRRPLRHPRYVVFHVPEKVGDTRVVSPEFIQAAHAADVHVYVWTIDAPEDIARLLSWGADGIITDRPDVGVALISKRSNPSDARL